MPEPRTLLLPRWVAASVIGSALVVLVLATSGDPVPLLTAPRRAPLGPPPGPLDLATATAGTATPTTSATPVPPAFDAAWVRPLVLGVLVVVAVAMLAGTVYGVVHVVRRLWEERWRSPDVPNAIGADPLDIDLHAARQGVSEAARDMRAALRAGSPRNAVVQCWLLLLDSLGTHGVTTHPSQSPTELAEHALSQVSTDRAAVSELTFLFLEARFSEHPMDETARRRAEVALARILSDLGQDDLAPVPPGPGTSS